MLLSIFEKKKINAIKAKKSKTQTQIVQRLLCFCCLIFSNKYNKSPEGFLTFFPKLCGRGRGFNCLFINSMVLKFLEDKALIPSVPSLSKNPLLHKFKWNPKQNGGDLGESKNAMHTLESAREKSFHPQTLKSVGLEMARLVNGPRRKCEWWPDPASEGLFAEGTEHGVTLNCHEPPWWQHKVARGDGRHREKTALSPPAPSHSPCETRIAWAGWMPATSTH